MPSDNRPRSQIFKCQKCGDCCKGYGGAFLTRKEIEVIADYIDTDPLSFVAKYCQLSGDKPVLSQGPNGYCMFWDKDCKIHAVKPQACKQWPFIKSVLIDVINWHIMAGVCPGMRTNVLDSTIAACVRKEIEKQ